MKTDKFRGFTPTPIYIVDEQVKNMQKQIYRQISNSLALYKLVRGFTLPELLTVIAIIALLIGVLMPALYQVKKMAKDTKQKAQLVSIEMGINLYKNDVGEYPPSHGDPNGSSNPSLNGYDYCGAQTLAEAMFGQDLLGFHPDSIYRADGKDASGNNKLYDFTGFTEAQKKANLDKRKEPYLARENIDVFKTGRVGSDEGVFDSKLFTENGLEKNKYVICDVFTAASRIIGGKSYKVGTPILYFRANTAAFKIDASNPPNSILDSIYNFYDNQYLVEQNRVADGKKHTSFLLDDGTCGPFYAYIGDPFASTSSLTRPVRPDSFLLISAGNDGFYGTKDDICNFEPNVPN